MNDTLTRSLLGVVLPAASVAAIVLPYLAVRGDLPDRIATNFDASGTPNRSMTPGMLIVTSLILAGAGIIACIWTAWPRRRHPAQVAATVAFVGGILAGMAAGVSLALVIGQRNVDDWREASNTWSTITVVLVLGLGAGAAAAALAAQLPHAEASGRNKLAHPVMDLDAGQHAVWTETLHSRSLQLMGLFVVAGGAVLASLTTWWAFVAAAAAGFAILSLATVQVRADRAGLHLRYGVLPWPRMSIDVADIEQASVIDVRPMEWGGWGYRGSLKLMKQAAVVHRAGPGIRLDLHGDKRFVVTVDHPEPPVALLNAEASRLGAAAT